MTAAEKAAAKKAAAVAAAAAAAAAAAPAEGANDWDEPAEGAEAQEGAEAAPATKASVPAVKPSASEFDGPVTVCCIVGNRPWTAEKALAMDEEATVSADVAAIMLKKKQVELV